MPVKLPNEVILQVSTTLAEDSSLDLKPFTLLNRRWHSVIAPALLSTISVSSLGKLVELCDHVTSFGEHTGGALQSTIETHAKTLVIAGEILDGGMLDPHVGLDDLGDIPRGEDELGDEPAEPDTTMPPAQILSKIHSAFPRFAALEGFEWYGRFAGDYHIVRYLQKAKVIKHLAYGIDMQVSSPSIAYRQNAFLFEGLKTLSVTTEYEPDGDMFPHTLAMVHRSPDLESILFDCKFAESLSGQWSLNDLICDTSKPGNPIFVWPNLRHLVLRFYRGRFWQDVQQMENLTRFLVAHPNIETLVLRETCLEDWESDTALPLSLSSHSDSLPRLRILSGSPRLLAGVLESRAASSSVTSIIDNSEEMFDSDGAKAPYVDRILAALEKAPDNHVRRIRLEIPQLSREVYARFARAVPGVRCLEFLKPSDGSGKKTTPQETSFDPVADIPASLNEFAQLDVVGTDIVNDFIKESGSPAYDALLDLAKQVPSIRAVHCEEGTLLRITRDSNGELGLSEVIDYMDSREYDWMTFEIDWRHRPLSRRAWRKIREEEVVGMDNLIRLVKK
ncbi:hypothetical protein BDV93DRAFT_559451 [Ceratobasidium sp. AG-I]|nr:hypothetical protein BDV93DRAFT_559451 [Ceratobasidium sp. AG-I]